MKRSHLRLCSSAAAALATLAVAACGSRTGLDLEPYPTVLSGGDASTTDALTPRPDAAHARDADETPDVSSPGDASDAAPPFDAASNDAPDDASDATSHDAPDDASDAASNDGADLCPDGGVTAAYIWGETGILYTFDPSTLATQALGVVTCPTTQTPWTLSVSRAGFGYFMYEDWLIYRVDLTTLACTPTPYQKGQLGFTGEEAIAVSRAAAEELYVYGMPSSEIPTLGVSDLTSFTLSSVGLVTPNPAPNAFPLDMQADAFGHLFALSLQGIFFELDATTGDVLVRNQTTFTSGGSWAIMTWNDQIFLFGGNEVSAYDPSTNVVTSLGLVGDSIVGASAAACIH